MEVGTVRRLALMIAGGALWLILAAVPALADGGPHVLTANNGSLGLNADGCAGCHRAHTAQGPFLINAVDETALCKTCHGAVATGSTVDVMTGVQYSLRGDAGVGGTQLGALRGGGFVQARIDAGSPYRYRYGDAEGGHPTVYAFDKKVGVGSAEAVTSSHLGDAEVGNGLSMPGIAWGNGAFSATANAGPAVTLSCASCHNPHGNGQYRILNPIPKPATGTLVEVSPAATWNIKVTDAPLPGAGDTRNYTVIQYKGPTAADRYLLASEIIDDLVPATAGDYWHQVVPFNARVADSEPANHDAPNGVPAFFSGQINAWCATCHSRYTQSTNYGQTNNTADPTKAEVAGNLRTNRIYNVDGTNTTGQPMVTPTGDGIYNYRHTTSRNRACTTCHVSHGSNAAMTGTYSNTFTYPDGTTVSPSSRLLKVDNRGTCQVCHDPTMTVLVGDSTGTLPTLP
jgi:predicted CXXCH cytochrome family protein